MDVELGEFQDWEVLPQSDDSGLVNSSDLVDDVRALEGIEVDSDGIIRSNYFSLDSQNKYGRAVAVGDVSEEGSVESDNPSWIDPGSETRYPMKEAGELWSDSSSDRSDDRKFNEFDAKDELSLVANADTEVGCEEIGEIGAESESSGEFCSNSVPVNFGDFVENNEMAIGDNVYSREGLGLSGEGKDADSSMEGGEKSNENENAVVEAIKPGSQEEKRTMVWWKLPLEFLRYCAFRVSPVLAVSVAAAVIGLVILGRRLHKMRRKSTSLQLKVTMDDKKVSQFMSRAARLNEAFSVVKRVPIIRPTLPGVGVTPWPMMSLR